MYSDPKDEFASELEKLNPGQRAAVEQIEGPILVVAGPGTGKTQILAARIGNILLKTDSQPHNILCLTYTDAGTVAMRNRLLKLIGPDAYRVHIFTFHAFCNQVIQENLDIFGYHDLQPVNDLEKVQLYQKLVDSFGPNHPLKRFTGDIYYDTYRLSSLFDLMKRENWHPEFISEKIDEFIEDIATRDEYIYKRATKNAKAGDLKPSYFSMVEDMEKLRSAALEFPKYNKMLRNIKRYDYNDMIIWVLEAFRDHPYLLSKYQEKYHYFLVDEYQDTNGAQNEILDQLTSFWDIPNVFVVGDDDQAIYRFQGANVSNIIDFHHRHKNHIKIFVLTENYRSGQKILDAAGKLIANNQERLVNVLANLNKELKASNEEVIVKAVAPEIRVYENRLQEEASVTKEIEKFYEGGGDLSQIAVIYRSHRIVENIVKALEQKQIPLNIKQKINILELPLVKNLITILEYLSDEQHKPGKSEYSLFEIMHFSFFNISSRDIAALARYCSEKRGEKYPSWRETIASREILFKLNLETARAISSLETNLSFWVKEIPNQTVQVLFEKILTHGGILTYIMNSPDKIWLMQVVTTFFDFIKEESERTRYLSLKELIETLRLMRKNKISLFINKVVRNEQGVNFITAHSSKGLEYEKVYLISSTRSCWDKPGRSTSFKMPDNLVSSDEQEMCEDERRLFYVAMTRAKENLVISYYKKQNSGKEEEASRFISEIVEKEVSFPAVTVAEEDLIRFQAQIMSGSTLPEVELFDREQIKDFLKSYKLSVTHLNKYLRCPLSFYFENIVRVPSARNNSIGFGSAVHYALFNLFIEMQKAEQKIFPPKSDLLSFFSRGMQIYHSHFTEKEYAQKMDYAEHILPLFYDHYINKWNKVVKVEYKINHCEVDGIPITGALDKIEFDGKNVNVVDYKTGDPERGKKKLNRPNEKDPLGGDYWRQIVFYKLLLDNDRSTNYEMVSGEIDFLQPDKKDQFYKEKVYVTPDDVKLVKEQMRDTYKKIMKLEFSQGCGEEDCQWCDFVRNNYKSEKLAPGKAVEEESL